MGRAAEAWVGVRPCSNLASKGQKGFQGYRPEDWKLGTA